MITQDEYQLLRSAAGLFRQRVVRDVGLTLKDQDQLSALIERLAASDRHPRVPEITPGQVDGPFWSDPLVLAAFERNVDYFTNALIDDHTHLTIAQAAALLVAVAKLGGALAAELEFVATRAEMIDALNDAGGVK